MMQHTQRTAVLILLLLAGSEAVRIHSQAQEGHVLNTTAIKTPDLDLPGCGQHALKCDAEGCKRLYLWLDTPGQTCRYTEEYKLSHRHLDFLKVELARLEEKSAKFAATGCLYGTGLSYDTYMWKCVRRTQQMIRLGRFVNKAIQAAKSDSMHPAHAYSSSQEVTDTLKRIGENIATGFDKHATPGGGSLAFGDAYKSLLALPEAQAKAEAACAKDESDCPASSSSKQVEEEAYITSAMLQMVGAKMTDEQKAVLVANIAGQKDEASTVNANDLLDGIAADIERTDVAGPLEDAATELSPVQKQAFHSELSQVGLGEAGKNGALVQVNDTNTVASRGDGPIKLIFKHGLGWIVTRVAWFLLYIIGAAVGIIRSVVIWPLLMVSCILMKGLKFLFVDLLYKGGWEGNGDAVVRSAKSVATCPAWAWEFVGFDPAAQGGDVVGQVFVQPATWASDATGVKHLWKSNKDLCKDVFCGHNTFCNAGKCHCQSGYYPIPDSPHCGLAVSKNGCLCKPTWQHTTALLFTQTYHGCAYGECKVETNTEFYQECKNKITQKMGAAKLLYKFVTNGQVKKDTCSPMPFMAQVEPVA